MPGWLPTLVTRRLARWLPSLALLRLSWLAARMVSARTAYNRD